MFNYYVQRILGKFYIKALFINFSQKIYTTTIFKPNLLHILGDYNILIILSPQKVLISGKPPLFNLYFRMIEQCKNAERKIWILKKELM